MTKSSKLTCACDSMAEPPARERAISSNSFATDQVCCCSPSKTCVCSISCSSGMIVHWSLARYCRQLPFARLASLLYQVTRHLDLHSQRNLCLCSPQLYYKWHLQIALNDSVWQFIQSCTEIIAETMSSGLCRSASLCYVLKALSGQRPDRGFDAALKFRPPGRP